CRNECVPVSHAPTSHPPVFRSPADSPSAAPPATPSTPAYTRRSPPGCAALAHRVSSPSRNRNSTRDSLAPGAAVHTNHPPTTVALAPAVSAAPSALRVARSAALDPSPPATLHSATAP